MRAMKASGIATPIATLAPEDREDLEGFDVDEAELVDVGVVLDDEVVGEEEDVGVTPSKARI